MTICIFYIINKVNAIAPSELPVDVPGLGGILEVGSMM
jgi:hypothetical protein